MSEIVVVCVAGGLLGSLVWCIWFATSSPLARLKSELKRRRWKYEIDLDGLFYRVQGTTDNLFWEANWDGRLLRPVFELTVSEESSADRWVFLQRRSGREESLSTLLVHAFTGEVHPPWLIGLSQATEIRTNLPEFDQEFFLAASGDCGSWHFRISPEFLSRLKNLPETILHGLLIIWGDGKLRVRIEGFREGSEFAPIEQVFELARQSLQQLRGLVEEESRLGAH